MLLLNKTLLRMARGLWRWILLITGLKLAALIGLTAFARIISSFLGNVNSPELTAADAGQAILSALLAAAAMLLSELLTGEVITQTFTTNRSFNHIGCKVLNPLGDANPSSYRIEVLDSDGNVLGSRDLGGGEVLNKDYAYVKFDTVVPDREETYTIRVTGLSAEPGEALTFLYYNSGNWDIYPEGEMTGLNSGEMSHLTFVVYDSVTKCFFN